MVNIAQTYFDIYFTEIIVGVLVLSIAIVLVSIFYVIFSSTDDAVIKKAIIKFHVLNADEIIVQTNLVKETFFKKINKYS